MDLTGKNVVFVAGLGGIGFEACKQLMTRNVAVSINKFGAYCIQATTVLTFSGFCSTWWFWMSWRT